MTTNTASESNDSIATPMQPSHNPETDQRLLQAGITPYPVETQHLYDLMITPATCGTIFGSSDGKTNLLCQMAVYAAMRGRKVKVFATNMPVASLRARINAVLLDVPLVAVECDAFNSYRSKHEGKRKKFQELCGEIEIQDVSQIQAEIPWVMYCVPRDSHYFDVLLVEGNLSQEDQRQLVPKFMDLAAKSSKTVWIAAAQPLSASCSAEFTPKQDVVGGNRPTGRISADRAPVIATITDSPWSVVLSAGTGSDQVAERRFHLDLTASLRLVTIPEPTKSASSSPAASLSPQFLHIGPSEDLPDEDEADDDGGIEQAAMGANKIGGFVGIKRPFFGSAMCQSRDFTHMGMMLDLYQMATIGSAQLYAPSTRTPVHIKRGQVMTSVRMLQRRWNLPNDRPVRTFLAAAQRDKLITVSHVLANGTTVQAAAPADTQTNTHRRIIASVITLCHYVDNTFSRQAGAGANVATVEAKDAPIEPQPRHNAVTVINR